MDSRKLPILLLMTFNFFTVFLYASMPFIQNSNNRLPCLLFILINLLCLYKGYNKGININLRKNYSYQPLGEISSRTLGYYFAIYSSTFLIIYFYQLRVPFLDFGALISRIIVGLADKHAGYTIKGAHTLPWSLFFLVSIVDSVFIIIGSLSWKKLKKYQKSLFVVFCIFEILFWFGKGTNFGLIILISTITFSVIANNQTITLSNKSIRNYAFLALFAFTLALLVFNINMTSRSGGDLANYDYNHITIPKGYINDNFIFNFIPQEFKSLYLYVCSYLTQGYYHLEYIFDTPYDWTMFFGNNPALAYLGEIFGINAEIISYQTKMEAIGIDPYIHWHSCYLWLANDFSIFGVPFVMYFLGKMMGVSYIIYQKNKDLLSGVIFIILSNMSLMLFANNNYISSVLYSLMFIHPYWYFSRYKKVKL